jgi:hypothetical protein
VRRDVFPEPLVVGVPLLTPAVIRVVDRLLREQELITGEVDGTLVIGCNWRFHAVHAGSVPARSVASFAVTYGDPNLDPWRRPDPGAEPVPGLTGQTPPVPPTGYSGPPPTDPPPMGWRPPTYVQPPPPRQLAPQDLDKVESQEKDARTLTYGVALVGAAVMVVLSCLLCSRVLF